MKRKMDCTLLDVNILRKVTDRLVYQHTERY